MPEQKEYVTLKEWAELKLSVQPSLQTLRSYARSGRFNPPAMNVGRFIMVYRDADLLPDIPPVRDVDAPTLSSRAAQILRR